MTDKRINLHDRMSLPDSVQFSREHSKKAPTFRTKIIGGYDPVVDEHGITQLGEVLFDTENETVLGGALFVLEKVFGVQSPLTVDYLNNIMNIATSGTPITEIYPKDNVVCLFGVGIGGAGDTISSVYDVDFKDREIIDMIPFRVTADTITDQKYWFRKPRQDGRTEYFLKSFEAKPTIKVLWRDGEGGEDGSEVETGVENSTRTDAIETFIEIILKIDKHDCREYFQINGNVEKTRVNSIGLFTGVKGTLSDNSTDYKQVKLFSKLNINNEMLVSEKSLTVVYRIYTS